MPPEARALNRFFRLLDDPADVREAFMDALDKAPASSNLRPIRQVVESIFDPLKQFEHRRDRLFEHKLALGINVAVENAFADSLDELESLGSPQKVAKSQNINRSICSDSSTLGRGHYPSKTTTDKTSDIASVALVSEASYAEQQESTSAVSEVLCTASDFWAYILEAIHLQIVSRTTRVWGRKKIYEIYRLNGPATSRKTFEQIRLDVQRDFSAAYSGIECRTYALQRQDGYLFLHLVIGKPYDYTDERNRSVSGEKKKKKANEFVIIVKPGSTLMALTASRAPSKSRFVKFVLTAIDLALATTEKNVAQNGEFPINLRPVPSGVFETHRLVALKVVYEPPTRVGDSYGTEPMDLLEAARAADTGEATGRFAHIASTDAQCDPLTELHQVATASLVDRSSEQARLQTSGLHGRSVGQDATEAAQSQGAALTMSTESGIVIDHEATRKEESLRLRRSTFGEGGPQRKKVRFKWTGTTAATSEAWGISGGKAAQSKCTISFHGADVFEGLREMLQLGIVHVPLPAYMHDATMVGTSTIIVRNGAVVADKTIER